ncbi:DNA polymerase III subunit delta [Candidatus Pelagibacter sp.]|nr:DNA polymerase III subunit delta [Candidatus Pelagibacter sp.]
MIIKFYEINKISLKKNQFVLLYGRNDGLINETINNLINIKIKTFNYEEKDILENENYFFENILTKSLFENEKIIIIKRATDKILKVFEEIDDKKLNDISIIITSDNLEKKSKLRSYFEKNKIYACVAFYPDTIQTLTKMAFNFLKEKNIAISMSNVNLIINKCNGDRESLLKELTKLEHYTKSGKKITSENLSKLTNLIENHSVSELVDNCLAKNKKKIINILNENNFSNEDCIMITRSFLIKAKKLLTLSKAFENNKNIDLTISSARPPIFWKEKEITKQQIYKWSPKNIKQLIYALGETELQIKKNVNNSINLITDFILSQSSAETNS